MGEHVTGVLLHCWGGEMVQPADQQFDNVHLNLKCSLAEQFLEMCPIDIVTHISKDVCTIIEYYSLTEKTPVRYSHRY